MTDAAPAGLTSAQARERLTRFGPNVPHARRERGVVVQFLSRFRNPLVLLLLVASGLSALSGDVASFVIIAVIVLLSVTLDFVQEHRAGRAAERLKASVAVSATALRDGEPREVAVADIVPDDVVLLKAGDLIPADGTLLEARHLFVNQALLTGESYPVEKNAGAEDEESRTALLGTSVVSGTGRLLVQRTGSRTQFGGVAESLATTPAPTAFQLGTQAFGLLIMQLTVMLVLFVMLVNLFFGRPWLESFLFALALAVGLTPELLPMVISVTLARGALRMAKKRVIVKRLQSIHNLGGMDVLCTDKTGTLTEARIRLERHVDGLGAPCDRVLTLAYLNSVHETGLKNPLDDAILEHREVDVARWHKVDEVPFDFERRRISVLVDDGTERLLVVKGAAEDVLGCATGFETAGDPSPRPLDEATRATMLAQFESLGDEGFRVLGIAWRRVPGEVSRVAAVDEAQLVFAGFAAFLDPPKPSAAESLRALRNADVRVKILTGDGERVTQHVCRQLGLDELRGLLTGAEIAGMDDPSLEARVDAVDLFCRVTPAQKNRVLQALRHRGHVVGYMGDGINDAPSLHSADVGLSVDGAVDVAREAADIILLEHDLSVLHDGVIEGRRTYSNIMKYVMMGTSSNFGNMFSMAGAALFLPFLPMLPVQILLNNLLYDLSEIAIPLDRVDAEDLAKPRHWNLASVRTFMIVLGPVSSVFDALTFVILLRVFHAGEVLFHTGWFVESLATQVLVIFVIRTRRNPFASRPHPALVATSLAVVVAAVALPFTPAASWLGFVAPPAPYFGFLAAMAAAYLVVVEFVKRAFYRRLRPAI